MDWIAPIDGGTFAEHVRSFGMPDSFVDRVATDVPNPK